MNRKAKLRDGTRIFAVNTRFLVRRSRFVLALTDHYYRYGTISQLSLLTKNLSSEILKDELRSFGLQGEYNDGFFESATDVMEARQNCIDTCSEWVTANYPSLGENVNDGIF